MARRRRRRRAGARNWYLLIHQLPPEPLYLRAKIRQRLERVGAVPLKNAVYVLPRTEDCLEDFEWVAQQAVAGGGEAYVCEATFPDLGTDASLIHRFRRDREADYSALAAEIRGKSRTKRSGDQGVPRWRRRHEEIGRVDFFKARGREEVERLLATLERPVRSDEDGLPGRPRRISGLSNRVWTTRTGVKVDRIASAWLIRKFLDPAARFRFIDPARDAPRPGEVRFDMVGGEFSHEQERCTFETLVYRSGLRDPALRPIGEIVHEIDLKDGRFDRPETHGIERLVAGIVNACPHDEERLQRGSALFDELYESFRGKKKRSRKETRK